MRKFGLIGKNISYSFSKKHFETKFQSEAITDASYDNFDIKDLSQLAEILTNNPNIVGLNVTIPYKEDILPYLDKITKKAKKIGAVNTIKISSKGKLIGYNTDYYGFSKSIKPFLTAKHKRALILGTGGASKAIAYALKKMDIPYQFVSRKPSKKGYFTYKSLTPDIINSHQIIINCTPLGTSPKVDEFPPIAYHAITNKHILFDLIYNPEETQFLKFGRQKNATTINGHAMLILQAEKAWKLWNQ